MSEERTTDGRRIEHAPVMAGDTSTGVLSVALRPTEEVEWHYSYGIDGTRHIYGYTIRKRANKPLDFAMQCPITRHC